MTKKIETDEIVIEYETINESFSHAFGTQKTVGYEIRNILVYIPVLGYWLNLTHMNEFEGIANKLIEKEGF